ncbi:MAG: OsmC family protein [Bacteroidota bacterium]
MGTYAYYLELMWSGNRHEISEDQENYSRDFEVTSNGIKTILGSADPQFKGNSEKINPHELFLASLASSHMLWYLHLCTIEKISVEHYTDSPQGTMEMESNGTVQFQEIILKPRIIIDRESKKALAESLHTKALRKCLIAKSVDFPIQIFSTIGSRSSN